MFSEGFSFPHPVLGLDDDIKGEFNCNIDVERNAEDRAIRFYNIRYSITNDYIRGLVENDEAGILIKIYCSSTFKTWTFIDPGESFQIDENDLFNKIDIDVLIITKKSIEEYKDNTFHSQFNGHTFSVNSKEILAVSGKLVMEIEKVDEKQGLGNIFKFFSHDSDKPIQFTYQDKIHIMYPVDIDGGHPPNSLFKSSPWTAYNMFIIPALTEAFRRAKEARHEVEGWEWFTVITSLFPEDEWEEEPFVNAQLLLRRGIPMLNAYHELKN